MLVFQIKIGMVLIYDAEGYEPTSMAKMNKNVARIKGTNHENRLFSVRNFVNEIRISLGSWQKFWCKI
jgi:hypothetical protein